MTSVCGRDAEQPIQIRSPPCRQTGESKRKCISRKVAELRDEGMEIDQAVAVATKMCGKKCEPDSY